MKERGVSRYQLGLMATAAGICVANIYYNQPILKEIAGSLQASEGAVGFISVLAQAGYGLGLFFITPLGDKTNRKKLILLLLIALLPALLGMVLVQNLPGLYALSLLIGLLAVAAQVIMPMVAGLDEANRGKNVGIVISGILIGILAARVYSGYVAAALGWQWVYAISAGMVALVAVLIQVSLPPQPAQFAGSYGQLLASTLQQVKRFALLRRAALLGALVFGVFCSFWTTLTFQLSGAPFFYDTDTIGLFGLLAIGGALLAPLIGDRAGKGKAAGTQLITVFLIIVGVLLVMIFPEDWWSFVIAVLLIDVGVQATQVANIALIYTLDVKAHSRINTIYMTAYFIGGALGTFAGVLSWRLGGWSLVGWQLLVWSVLALGVAAWGYRVQRTVLLPNP